MRTIKIGTRASQLALWQANLVKSKIEALGHLAKIVEVSATGDEILDKPLHKIGGFGLFTRNLDNAMLKGKIDLAVHSLKDVPTCLPNKIVQAAVMQRASVYDVLILKSNSNFLTLDKTAVIATGSLRRKAQWLHKYPNHKIEQLRGNVNTRLQKLQDNNWDGAIFAAAGLQRVALLPQNHLILDWMIPAPAQGAIMVTALESDKDLLKICNQINHTETEIAVAVERQFMQTLEGGCTAPIGGLASINGEIINFKGILSALDGSQKVEVNKVDSLKNWKNFGEQCALEVLNNGGKALMTRIKSEMNN